MPRLKDWVPSLLLLGDLGDIAAMYAVDGDGNSRSIDPSSFDEFLATQAELNSAVIDAAVSALPAAFAVNEEFTSRFVPLQFNLKHYGAVGDGVTDDSAAIVAWLAAAAAAGGGDLYAPRGIYKTTVAGITHTGPSAWATPGKIGVVPSNSRMYGVPGKSIFYMTGVPAAAYGTPNQYTLFGIVDGSSNITFEGLTFRGENSPFVYYLNNESAAIDILLTSSVDITVRHCRFEHLYGFTVHDRGGCQRVHVYNCSSFETANGLNVNASNSIQSNNVFDTSEGIECSGRNVTVVGNVFHDCQGVAISMGGSGNSDGQKGGNQIVGTVSDGCTGQGIRLGDNVVGAVISGNTIKGCELGAIGESGASFGPGDGAYPTGCLYIGNTIHGNCKTGVSVVCVDLAGAGQMFVGNQVFDDGDDVLFPQPIALVVRGENNYIAGNYLSGPNNDLDITNTATGLALGRNYYANGTIGWDGGGTSSLAVELLLGKAEAKYFETRLSGDPTLADYSRFAMFLSGKLEWGSAASARDVNLFRYAADVLATDDAFKFGSSSTGGRPSAAGVGVGVQWYDTTLHKPIYSDGANWRDAAGTIV